MNSISNAEESHENIAYQSGLGNAALLPLQKIFRTRRQFVPGFQRASIQAERRSSRWSKGKSTRLKFRRSAGRCPPLQPLPEEPSGTFPVCTRHVCSLALLLPREKRAQQPLTPRRLPRSFLEVPVRLPPGSGFTTLNVPDRTSRSYCPRCWKTPALPAVQSREGGRPPRLENLTPIPGFPAW